MGTKRRSMKRSDPQKRIRYQNSAKNAALKAQAGKPKALQIAKAVDKIIKEKGLIIHTKRNIFLSNVERIVMGASKGGGSISIPINARSVEEPTKTIKLFVVFKSDITIEVHKKKKK